MNTSDINRHRKQNIKQGAFSDKAIIGGVKRGFNAIKTFPDKVGNYINKKVKKAADKTYKK
jgi:hypothetical protein